MRAVYNGCMEKGVNNMIEAIEGFRLPRYAQIPDVGLYLEQVVRYVNTHLAPLGEPELTSSILLPDTDVRAQQPTGSIRHGIQRIRIL